MFDEILQNFEIRAAQNCENLVDLEKCCKMTIYLQRSAPIQPRTSLGKSDVSWLMHPDEEDHAGCMISLELQQLFRIEGELHHDAAARAAGLALGSLDMAGNARHPLDLLAGQVS